MTGTLYAFYRVAAVDEKGNASGASDYAELPRPFIYSVPPLTAKAGQEYRYKPVAVFSLGHLTCRDGYNEAFWEREQLTWTLEIFPKWLAITDGTVSGDAGR